MTVSRRHVIAVSGAAMAATAAAPAAAAFGIPATDLGLKPGAPDDQTSLLQRAIDHAAQARTPLILPPGTYRSGELRLPAHAKLAGTRGESRIELLRGTSLFVSNGVTGIELTGLVIDGAKKMPA